MTRWYWACTHLVGLQAAGALQLGLVVEVGVGGLVREPQPSVGHHLEVGVGHRAVAPAGVPVLAVVAAVDQLLLAVVHPAVRPRHLGIDKYVDNP